MTNQTTVTVNADGTHRLPSGADFFIDSFPESTNVQLDVYKTPEADELGGASMMVELDTDPDDVRAWLESVGIADESERENLVILIDCHFNAMDEVW